MRILAIDTSCDDTSVAISDDLNILANVFWSKMKLHSKWGGVVPAEARRQHKEFLGPAIDEVCKQAKLSLNKIDIFAVTQGPGLAIALEAGIAKAKELANEHKKPLIAVNHMIGHIYSNLTQDSNGKPYAGLDKFEFPLLALTISGGHTDLYLMKGHLEFEHLGQTLDDAVGEAFDKIGRMLGMGFPAGAEIEKSAQEGNPSTFQFPRPLSNSQDYNWSYSGLKTAVLYEVQKIIGDYKVKQGKGQFKFIDISDKLDKETINDIAASFQEAAIESLLIKVKRAVEAYKPKMFVVGGGVIANTTLRRSLEDTLFLTNTPLYYPKPIWLCTDNAAMIATAAYFYAKENKFVKNSRELDRIPNLKIS